MCDACALIRVKNSSIVSLIVGVNEQNRIIWQKFQVEASFPIVYIILFPHLTVEASIQFDFSFPFCPFCDNPFPVVSYLTYCGIYSFKRYIILFNTNNGIKIEFSTGF